MKTTEPMGQVHQQGNSIVITSDRQPYFPALLEAMSQAGERYADESGGVMIAHHGPDGQELAPAFVQSETHRFFAESGLPEPSFRLIIHHIAGCPTTQQWPALCTCPPRVTIEGPRERV